MSRKPDPQSLNKWRVIAGLKLPFVAKHLGWPEIHLARLEAGLAIATQDEISALARFYVCKPADLLRQPSRDELRRRFGYNQPGFTQKEGDIIRHALRIAIEHGAVFEQRHVESIERKLARYHDKNASRTEGGKQVGNSGKQI